MHLGSIPPRLEAACRQAGRVLLVGHTQPDADCLGALGAFVLYLEGLGVAADVYCATPTPRRWRWLPGVGRLKTTYRGPYGAVVVLDCGDLAHAVISPRELTALGASVIANIDHHHTNARFGTHNLVCPDASSTTEILYHFLRQLRAPLTPPMATALLAGILGDTGGFRHPNTTPAVLATAAELVSAGADWRKLWDVTFRDKTVVTLQRWGRVLSRVTRHPEFNLAIAVVPAADLAGVPDASALVAGLANFLNTLDDVRAVLVLVEQADGTVRGSLRSKDPLLDVSAFATLCGGGGHKLAAGFTIKGRLQETPRGWRIIG